MAIDITLSSVSCYLGTVGKLSSGRSLRGPYASNIHFPTNLIFDQIYKPTEFLITIESIAFAFTFEVIHMARNVRSKEERLTALEQKIEKKKAELATLEAQKEKLLHPVNMRTVMAKAKELGLTADEIAEKLGIELD